MVPASQFPENDFTEVLYTSYERIHCCLKCAKRLLPLLPEVFKKTGCKFSRGPPCIYDTAGLLLLTRQKNSREGSWNARSKRFLTGISWQITVKGDRALFWTLPARRTLCFPPDLRAFPRDFRISTLKACPINCVPGGHHLKWSNIIFRLS